MPLVLCPACSGQRLLQTKSRRRVSAWDLVLCYMPVAPEMNFMDFCGSWVPPQDRPLLTSSEACECLPACMYMNQCTPCVQWGQEKAWELDIQTVHWEPILGSLQEQPVSLSLWSSFSPGSLPLPSCLSTCCFSILFSNVPSCFPDLGHFPKAYFLILPRDFLVHRKPQLRWSHSFWEVLRTHVLNSLDLCFLGTWDVDCFTDSVIFLWVHNFFPGVTLVWHRTFTTFFCLWPLFSWRYILTGAG